ncbi:MAG: hypothetical protein AB3N16_09910 [Flavobacteriaceae bacterium]
MGTEVLYGFAKVFGATTLCYLVFVFLYRTRIVRRKKQSAAKKEEISQWIGELLFFDFGEASNREKEAYLLKKTQLREWIAVKENRELLVAQMLRLRLDVAGEAKNTLITLYKDLNLHLYAVQNLKSWRWEIVSAAILELTQMHMAEAYIPIRGFLNDKRKVVREQAEIAIISLKEEGIAHYLDTVKTEISEWQQLKIIEILKSRNQFNMPNFEKWFSAHNSGTIMLALRLAEAFGQSGVSSHLSDVIVHKQKEIRELGYSLVQKFGAEEVKPTMKLYYWKCSGDERLNILQAFYSMGNHEDVGFMEEVYHRETSETHLDLANKILDKLAPNRAKKDTNPIREAHDRPFEGMSTEEKGDRPPIKLVQGDTMSKMGEGTHGLSILNTYFDQDNFNRMLLLDAVSKTKDKEDISLLRLVVAKETNLAIKIKALEILRSFGINELEDVSKTVPLHDLIKESRATR